MAAGTFCTTAAANGRFPEAQAIESVPGSGGKDVFLRTTFGVLVSHDAGKRWRWICERALGYDGQWDPPIVATRDGRLWVGLEDGLASTRDGCDFERVPELEGHTVKDLTTDASGEAVWAITGAPTKTSYAWRRKPFAPSFDRLASFDETNVMTIEVASGTPSRVYVSGQPYTTIRGRIYRSDDGGATFSEALTPGDAGTTGLTADGPLFIGSVDPVNSSRLLVRHLHAKGSDLYLSKDGGRTLSLVLAMKSAMFGFAKSADGATIWAGSGLPEHGIYRSTDRGEHFEVVSHHGVLCLHAAAKDALFVCENAAAFGKSAVAVAHDGVGKEIVPLARFVDVEGPISCDAGASASAICRAAWPEVRASFSPSDAGPALPRTPTPPSAGEQAPRRACACACEAVGSENGASVGGYVLFALLGTVRRRINRGSLADHRVGRAAPPRPQSHGG
jgi:hypothetical protein